MGNLGGEDGRDRGKLQHHEINILALKESTRTVNLAQSKELGGGGHEREISNAGR